MSRGAAVSLAAKSWALLQRDVLLFVTNLATSVVVARSLGPRVLGLWVILQLVLSYAEAFGRLKTDAAAVYFLGQGKYPIADVVLTLHAIALTSALAIVLPIELFHEAFANLVFAEHAAEVRPHLFAVLVQVPILFVYMNYVYLFIHREDVRSYNAMVVIRSLLSSVLAIVSLLVFDLGLPAVIWSNAIGLSAATLFAVSTFRGGSRKAGWTNLPLLKDLLGYGMKLYAGVVFAQLNAYVSQSLVAAFCAPAQVAFFAMAQNQGQMISKVTDALGSMLYPRISKTEDKRASAALAAKAFRVALILLSVAAVAAAILIRPVVLILYGRAYEPMLVPFYIILPGLVIGSAASTLLQYFQGIGRADLVPKIGVLPVIAQTALGIVLIPRHGITAAAIVLLSAVTISAAVQVYFFVRLSGTSVRRDLLVRRADVQLVSRFLMKLIPRRSA